MIAQNSQARTGSIRWSQETMISRDLSLNVRRDFCSTQEITVLNIRQLCGSLEDNALGKTNGHTLIFWMRTNHSLLPTILVYFSEFSVQFSNGPYLYTWYSHSMRQKFIRNRDSDGLRNVLSSKEGDSVAIPPFQSQAHFFQLLFQSQMSWQGHGDDDTVGWHTVVTNRRQTVAGSASTV